MKKFWLVLFPDVFLWEKNNLGIIYNSINFRHKVFHSNAILSKLCQSLADLDNLYSTEITEILLRNETIKQWVDLIIGIEAGTLIEQDGYNKKLPSYSPLLRIQNNIGNLVKENDQDKFGKIVENLHELVFYINGSLLGSSNYFRQTYYPIRTNESLEFDHIASFVDACYNKMFQQVTIIGDLINYKDINSLKEWIISYDCVFQFILLAEDIMKDITKLEWLNSDKICLTVIVNNYSLYVEKHELFQRVAERITFVFPVESIDDLNLVFEALQETETTNYSIVPLFNDANMEFFEDNVYLTIDDLNEVKLSKREVFINMTLNIHSFGKFTIMPDRKIYSNVNNSSLGVIGDSICDLISHEMTKGNAWFKVRNMEPCCNCIYQWLCPSPSNYEFAVNKPNLCHINNKIISIS